MTSGHGSAILSEAKNLERSRERDFAQRVKELSRQDVQRCYFCQKCSAGCPTAYAMDYAPAQVLKMVQLAMEEALLESAAIWLCIGCETCGTRCPNGISLAPVMDVLKQMALAKGHAPAEPRSLVFHRSFVHSIKLLGRVHEATMLAEYKLRSKDLWSDLGLGLRMFLRGKLNLLPRRVAQVKQVRDILARSHPPEAS
jgi:heterodisulfide reductase subunit C